jgi:hypothetical protein
MFPVGTTFSGLVRWHTMTSASLTAPRLSKSHLRGAAASITVITLFALIWGINGSLALSGIWRFLALGVVVLVTAAFAGAVLTFSRQAAHAPAGSGLPMPNPFLTTAYRVSVIGMVVALLVTARILTANGLSDAIMPAAVTIVGLHFFGLILPFRSVLYAWVGGAFCVLGLASLLLPVALRIPVLGLGCAVILWLGAMPLVLQTLNSIRHSSEV